APSTSRCPSARSPTSSRSTRSFCPRIRSSRWARRLANDARVCSGVAALSRAGRGVAVGTASIGWLLLPTAREGAGAGIDPARASKGHSREFRWSSEREGRGAAGRRAPGSARGAEPRAQLGSELGVALLLGARERAQRRRARVVGATGGGVRRRERVE